MKKLDNTDAAIIEQQEPAGDGQPVIDEVITDLKARAEIGRIKYGTILRINNGRDALIDAYQEALDLCMYLKQAIMERKNENTSDH